MHNYPKWLPRIVAEIRRFAEAERVHVTGKAKGELQVLDMGLDELDIVQALQEVSVREFCRRLPSKRIPGDWLYEFKFELGGLDLLLYTKVSLRDSICSVVSFHEDQNEDDDY